MSRIYSVHPCVANRCLSSIGKYIENEQPTKGESLIVTGTNYGCMTEVLPLGEHSFIVTTYKGVFELRSTNASN